MLDEFARIKREQERERERERENIYLVIDKREYT